MNMQTPTITLDRAAWLEQRRTGIGGSDAAAVLGLSKWHSPLSLWLDKTGQAAENTDNEDEKRWGTILEPVIKQVYSEKTGRTIVQPGFYRHPEHHYMVANVDGISPADNRLIEIKTARTGEGWGEEGSDQVPDEYLIQTQHYMAVLRLRVADIAVLIGGSDFRIYTVHADDELHQILVDAERQFWQSVVDLTPPAPQSYADAQALYRKSIDKSIVVNEPTLEAAAQLRLVKAEKKALEAEEDRLKGVIAAYMGEHDTLIAPNGEKLVTWKVGAPPKRLDTKALAAAHPDIAAQFTKEGEASRRFLLKGER